VNNDLYYDLSLAPSDFWNRVRSDGGDIRVTAQDGTTQLAREVSGFDYAGHKGSLFIGMGAATSCYIYYGNATATEPAAGSTYGSRNTWETPAKIVAHAEEGASPLLDSTADGNSLAVSGNVTLAQTGQIQKDAYFYGGKAAPSGAVLSTDVYTAVMWLKVDIINASPQYPFSRGGGAENKYDAFGLYAYQWLIFNGTTVIGGSSNPSSGVWYHCVVMRNGSLVKLVVNNQVVIDWTTLAITYDSGAVKFGSRIDADAWPYSGQLDEPRVYDNRLLSPTEIATMYANQSSPASFWTTGAEVQGANPAWNYLQGS
jgi:hypothetical protein